MKRSLLPKLLLLFLFLNSSSCRCSKSDGVQSGQWIDQFVATMNESTEDNPIKIDQFVFRQDTLYYMTFPCCDRMSRLYTKYGEEICRPDGGITGMGDGRCPDFRLGGKFIRTIWQEGDPEREDQRLSR